MNLSKSQSFEKFAENHYHFFQSKIYIWTFCNLQFCNLQSTYQWFQTIFSSKNEKIRKIALYSQHLKGGRQRNEQKNTAIRISVEYFLR